MKTIFKLCISIFIILLNVWSMGFTFSYLWKWFIEFKFNLPHISILEGYGITLIFLILTYRITLNEIDIIFEDAKLKIDNNLRNIYMSFGSRIVIAFSSLFIGYIIHKIIT